MPRVKTYSYKRDGNKSLSENFKVSEFKCKDGTDKMLIDLEMIYILQEIRNISGKSVTINSAYRTVSWNRKQGGVSNSYHLYGRAFDIKTAGLSLDDICAIANTLGVKGIIKYPTFVHIDSRANKYHATNTKKLMNYGKYTIPFKGTTLRSGSKGQEVALVQFKLNSLGYNCGIVDGIAGAKFDKAVKAYQKANGLAVDGKVGTKTWTKLFS